MREHSGLKLATSLMLGSPIPRVPLVKRSAFFFGTAVARRLPAVFFFNRMWRSACERFSFRLGQLLNRLHDLRP